MVCGVSGGIAEYFGVDVAFVRIGWVLLSFCTAGFAIVGYALLCLVLPEDEMVDVRSAGPGSTSGEGPGASAIGRASAKKLTEEARLLLDAKRELGDDCDEQLVDSFAQKVEEALKSRRVDSSRGGRQERRSTRGRGRFGVLLVGAGALLLVGASGALSWSFWTVLSSVVLISGGAAVLARRAGS